ncbi:cyclic nucleotide-binding protein [Maridesulfovibrio sp.]|uniref:cyclic nucleotide-binding protein n=1 Tax=Maridesulfovibrio sp. TaxID=2795000 RepID=UPI002A187BB6|nr:cyclic nucleotide-binding protein [Maridesulfovibrio sp.]
MRSCFYSNLIILLLAMGLCPAAVSAAPLLSIGDFQYQNGTAAPEFTEFLHAAVCSEGLNCANSTAVPKNARYTISGILNTGRKGTSYSAMLTDTFHLEPDVFINGKQVGGKTSAPAAKKLAKSIYGLLSVQKVSSVDISGNVMMAPGAIMALSGIFPGEEATPQKVIAARIILEDCGLFEQVRIFLIPGADGRKVKISVKENLMLSASGMPGPGRDVLTNILGAPENELPEFPDSLATELAFPHPEKISGEMLAYRAEKILEQISMQGEKDSPEAMEELIEVAAAIRNRIYVYDSSCRNMCIILLKLCSVLDRRTVQNLTDRLQREPASGPEDRSFSRKLARIEFLGKAQAAAQDAMTILAARIYSDHPHSPALPWVLFALGKQAVSSEDLTRAAPLLAAATAYSSLPVSPEMLITAAKAQYSNLDSKGGDAASGMLKSMLEDPELPSGLRRKINSLEHWNALCKTALSITDGDSFDQKLRKGNALILLDRPDLAEPLFHELHSAHPDDARPFTGFARLAFQRTGNLLSVRPYIERAARLSGKDRFFYELSLAYTLERITEEALPTIRRDGRDSEEAAATRFLLPRAEQCAVGYERFNRPRALLLKNGIEVLDHWLAYPKMTDTQALDAMYNRTVLLSGQEPDDQLIKSAEYYFSTSSPDRTAVRQMLCEPLAFSAAAETRFLQLNLLIREMAVSPAEEIAAALERADRATFSNDLNRNRAVAIQADTHALLGLYRHSVPELERARSLYALAVTLNSSTEHARLLNNQAAVNLALDRKEEADDLYDEAADNPVQVPEAIELGKIFTALPAEEQDGKLCDLAERTQNPKVRAAARKHMHMKNSGMDEKNETVKTTNGTEAVPPANLASGMPEVLLQEEYGMGGDYDNYNGLQLFFRYESSPWLIPGTSEITGG